MMQTVNASLMKATVQDMQTYLHHLERLLGMDLHANPHQSVSHQSVSHQMEQPRHDQALMISHLEHLSQSIHGLDKKIDSHMVVISELSNRLAQVEETQQELLAHSNVIPVMHNISDYTFDNPLISANTIDDCAMVSSSADAIFSSDSVQSITVCKIDAPINEIIIPQERLAPIPSLVEGPVVEAPNIVETLIIETLVIETPIVETPVVETPAVEAPKVTEVPKVIEVPKVTEVPKVVEAPTVVEAPKAEVLPVESTSEEQADGEEEEEEEEEGEEVEEITYNGETYYKDADGFIYKPDDDTPIGYWKEKTQSIAFYRTKK
jgi:hypothetical protein